MSSIIIADYDPTWPTKFEEEKACILTAADDYIEDIQHIGSTSVPGLGAKPIIDIMVGLRELSLVEKCVPPLQTLGYEYMGEYGIPERHYFRKPDNDSWTERTHQIHMVVKGSDFWQRHLLFRDYLRLHPEDARQYYLLKKALALKFDAGEDYTDAKTEFIEAIVAKAALQAKE
jgi:GrpB-like predicted nucleotidyltransferase (UPF0157 family)